MVHDIDVCPTTRKVLEFVQGCIGLARAVVVEGRIPPIVGDLLIAVVFRPPPEEALYTCVSIELGDEVGSKAALSLFGIGVGSCVIVLCTNGPCIAVTSFDNHDIFAISLALQRIQRSFQCGQIAMMVRVVA